MKTKAMAKLFPLVAASLIVATSVASAQAQSSPLMPPGTLTPKTSGWSKITLSSRDQALIQRAAQILASSGHAVTMTETHTEGGGSKTWSFDPASSPMVSVSEAKLANSSSYSVSAETSRGTLPTQGADAPFNCAQWTSKFNVRCTVETAE